MNQQEILNTPIQDLPFTSDLKIILLNQGLKTLQEVVNVPVYRWHDYPSFTYHHQYEIVDYLQELDLMDFIKED
ncbi:hypothetical protein OCK74_27300 [Chitinophagaceae bacterium LB-8]|uniref:Uncharacterized protein n=1 Tax=Paraflavisolibacter caeni TaxID=2982496 RepID=A0A9X2Y166_9BACT|nr:hypothetical protein [Paraflavisolibacter caeni]MCU7552856.1 hypothetical protein [Paraflavisolibacter caeni]